MPLFGKKKDPSQLIAETKVKLIELVVQCDQNKITHEQLEQRFYTTLRDGFPMQWFGDPQVAESCWYCGYADRFESVVMPGQVKVVAYSSLFLVLSVPEHMRRVKGHFWKKLVHITSCRAIIWYQVKPLSSTKSGKEGTQNGRLWEPGVPFVNC